MQGLNFTALDFELANSVYTSACSLGLVKVVDGLVVEQRHWLIRPHPYEMGVVQRRIHGISLSALANQPTFGQLWGEVAPYLEGQMLVTHNSSFDIGVLTAICEHYAVDGEYLDDFCTYRSAPAAWPGLVDYKLKTLCQHLEIELNHHDAASDALASARIAIEIARLNNTADLSSILKSKRKATVEKKKRDSSEFFAQKGGVALDEVDMPWTEVDTHAWSWESKKVLVSGVFSAWNRDDLKAILIGRGAKLMSTPNKTMHVFVVGNNLGPSKLEKVRNLISEGHQIQVIGEAEVITLLAN